MKKLLSIFLFVLAALPMPARGMQTMTEKELAAVTGQAGVSINVDVTANVSMGTLAWGDSDGLGSYSDGTTYSNWGYVGVANFGMTFRMSGRSDGPFAATGGTMAYLPNKPITIDVGTSIAGTNMVRFGLPTAYIGISDMDMDIFLSGDAGQAGGGAAPGAPASTTAQQLGHIYMGDVDILLGQLNSATGAYDAGYITMTGAGPGNSGVSIGLNVAIDSITMGALSYGNTSSILASSPSAGTMSAGYVGIANLVMNKVNVNGGIYIGVGTLSDPAPGGSSSGTSMVNIIIANGTAITVGTIAGKVVLAPEKTLGTGTGTASPGTLGNFYISNLNVTFLDSTAASTSTGGTVVPYSASYTQSSSKVQIWAH